MEQKNNKDVFYVGIQNPVEIRKSILECSRDLLKALQHYERVRLIREKKAELTFQFKAIIRDLDKLNNSLRLNFPKTNIYPKKKQEVQKPFKLISKESKPTTQKEKKHLSAIDKLQLELDAIESKLGKLSN